MASGARGESVFRLTAEVTALKKRNKVRPCFWWSHSTQVQVCAALRCLDVRMFPALADHPLLALQELKEQLATLRRAAKATTIVKQAGTPAGGRWGSLMQHTASLPDIGKPGAWPKTAERGVGGGGDAGGEANELRRQVQALEAKALTAAADAAAATLKLQVRQLEQAVAYERAASSAAQQKAAAAERANAGAHGRGRERPIDCAPFYFERPFTGPGERVSAV